MTSFLHIASRVEAAMEAYISVRDFADREEWKGKFRGEMQNATYEYRRVWNENRGYFTALPPTLVALSIVLEQDEDLGRINRSHPDREEHNYFNPNTVFAADISDLLPPSADRWWESLAEAAHRAHTAEAGRTAHAAETSPPAPAPVLLQHKVKSVRLLVSAWKPQPEEKESSEDLPMAVDKEPKSRGRPRPSKGAAAKRKRKGSSAAPCGGAKRRNQSRQHPEPAEQGSGRSSADQDPVEQGSGRTPVIEVKKGKQRACDSPEAGESEGSGPAPSPLETLAGLGTLRLDTSPATLPQPPLPEHAALAPPLGPKTRHPAKPSAGVTLEVPGTSNPLDPAPLQVTRSRSDASLDGASITTRIAALENRQDEVEKWMRNFDRRLKQLGG
ncbi:hypothetical protein V8E52_007982 [Russula decolorans]